MWELFLPYPVYAWHKEWDLSLLLFKITYYQCRHTFDGLRNIYHRGKLENVIRLSVCVLVPLLHCLSTCVRNAAFFSVHPAFVARCHITKRVGINQK